MFMNFQKSIIRFLDNESGASMVEYSLALLVVTAIGIGAVSAIGGNTSIMTSNACTTLENNTPAPAVSC